MGRSGPPRKSEQRRAIQTDRKRRRRKGAESPQPKGAAWLKCPREFRGGAREAWNRLAAELAHQGLLGILDLSQFRAYCAAIGRYEEYEKLCAKHGAEAAIKLGYRRAADSALQAMLKLSARFGLDPASRENVTANPPKSDKDQTADPRRARFFGMRSGLKGIDGGKK
jgi:P27 family predicted phage terminase small subunit